MAGLGGSTGTLPSRRCRMESEVWPGRRSGPSRPCHEDRPGRPAPRNARVRRVRAPWPDPAWRTPPTFTTIGDEGSGRRLTISRTGTVKPEAMSRRSLRIVQLGREIVSSIRGLAGARLAVRWPIRSWTSSRNSSIDRFAFAATRMDRSSRARSRLRSKTDLSGKSVRTCPVLVH